MGALPHTNKAGGKGLGLSPNTPTRRATSFLSLLIEFPSLHLSIPPSLSFSLFLSFSAPRGSCLRTEVAVCVYVCGCVAVCVWLVCLWERESVCMCVCVCVCVCV